MKKKIQLFLIVSLICSFLSGCVNEKATITTTVYPVKYLVEQLAGDKVNVQYLSSDDIIQKATIVEDYDNILNNTTVFFYINDLEPYMSLYPEILENYQMEVVNLADLSAIYEFKRYNFFII